MRILYDTMIWEAFQWEFPNKVVCCFYYRLSINLFDEKAGSCVNGITVHKNLDRLKVQDGYFILPLYVEQLQLADRMNTLRSCIIVRFPSSRCLFQWIADRNICFRFIMQRGETSGRPSASGKTDGWPVFAKSRRRELLPFFGWVSGAGSETLPARKLRSDFAKRWAFFIDPLSAGEILFSDTKNRKSPCGQRRESPEQKDLAEYLRRFRRVQTEILLKSYITGAWKHCFKLIYYRGKVEVMNE